MARFYYTADGVTFPGPGAADKAPYLEGRDYTLPAGAPGNGLHVAPVRTALEASGLYLAVEDNTQCTPVEYYTVTLDLAMQGPLLAVGTRVVETRTCVELPIAELYDVKRGEVARQDQSVRYNAVDTDLAANWWLVATQSMRFELLGIQGNWLQRQNDSLAWPSGPNAPWVGIYNAANGRARRVQVVNETDWETLFLELTQHDQATGNATEASLAALDAAYDDGNGVWADVAAHDAANPAWGYPPTVDLSEVARVLFGG